MKLNLALGLVLLSLGSSAQAEIWRAPGFVDWFVRQFGRIQSFLQLDAEQEQRLQAAKKPLASALEEEIRIERERVVKMRALFERESFSADNLRAVVRERRRLMDASEVRIRNAATELLAALHGILRPPQRAKLLDSWSNLVERRHQRYERPLH